MANLLRHESIFKPSMLDGTPIHIIGCGATGSSIALNLVKLGVPELHLYDMDIVEEHNLANQFFIDEDVGKMKASSLAKNLVEFCANENTKVFSHTEEITAENAKNLIENGIVFCVTDTMKSRDEIFTNLAKANFGIKLWIETRMSLDAMRVYTINPTNFTHCTEYEKTLYTDENTVVSACGSTQTAFPTASMLAAISVWMMLAHLNEKEYPNEFMQCLPGMETFTRNF